MAKRKAISKKLRFQIFSRDAFTCQYCGRTPPDAILHVDHITPVAQGGTNDELNLVTACQDCNLGKSKHTIESIRVKARVNQKILDRAREAREQLEKYQAYLVEQQEFRNERLAAIEMVLRDKFGRTLSDAGKRSVTKLLEQLPVEDAVEAMKIACNKIQDPENAIKYFYGICRNKIRYARDPRAEAMDRTFYAFERDYRELSHHPPRHHLKKWWERCVWERSSGSSVGAQAIGREMISELREQWKFSNYTGYFRLLSEVVEPSGDWELRLEDQ